MSHDAIIIGGGIMGLNIANALLDQGLRSVALIEKRFLGAGSSGKSGAILRQHYSHAQTVRMSRDSLAFYRTFQSKHGHDIGFSQTGMLFLCHRADRSALQANVALQKSLGVPVDLVEGSALQKIEPRADFGDEALGAYEQDAGYVVPQKALYGLAKLAVSKGLQLIEGVAAQPRFTGAPRKVLGAKLSDGRTLHAPIVVNAGGPWAKQLMKELAFKPQLTVVRPQQAFLAPNPRQGAHTLVFGDLLTGIYWKPEHSGWLRIGQLDYTSDDVVPDPDEYDESASMRFLHSTRTRIVRRLPELKDAISWGGCAALYTITPDAHPLIGPVPDVQGLYLAAGFSGHGFKLGPAVGRGLAATITGEDIGDAFDPEFFAVDRLDRGAKITNNYTYGILG